jgi:protein TonB
MEQSTIERNSTTVNNEPVSPAVAESQEAEAHLQRLLASSVEIPWYKSLVNNVREVIHPPKLPPLEVTSKPVPVENLWGFHQDHHKTAGLGSVLIHCAVVLLLFTIGSNRHVQQAAKDVVTLIAPDIAAWQPKVAPQKQAMGGGGGGGDRSPTPPSKGKLPRASNKQFTPPTAVILNEHPKLPMEPTIIAPPEAIPQISAANYGDPLSKFAGMPSNGPGSGGGIGTGSGGGVGSGRGAGYGPGSGGGVGGGVYRIGGGVSAPQLVFKVEPEYSEEARKAKFQGTVVLYVVVDEKGNPRDLKVVRALGLGLDQKAIEAVQKWRFKPGLKDGKPVPVAAQIEVNFRLL